MHTKHMAPLFKSDFPNTVTFHCDGEMLTAPEGITVAAALLLSGARAFRTTPVTSAPRAAYCMMGVCFDCLVEIDGAPSLQACQILLRDGMSIKRQQGASELSPEKCGEVHGR